MKNKNKMDFQGSQLLSAKNLSKTWSFILTLVTLLWVVGQKNLVVRASVIDSGRTGDPVRQGAFKGDSVSDHSNGLRGEKHGGSDRTGRPGQLGGRDRWATTSQRTQGKSTFTIKESADRNEDFARTWLEGRLSHSEDNRVNDRGEEEETVSSDGKRSWFQSWSGKRRRNLGPVDTTNKGTAERGLKRLGLKEVPDNEDGIAKFTSENIIGPTKILNSAQQFRGESWSPGPDSVQGPLQNDGKISREASDENWESLARYQSHINQIYDYLNSQGGRQSTIGDSKYFSLIPYFYNVPNLQTAQDKNIPDQGNVFSNSDSDSQFNVNQKKSAQGETPESDWSSSRQRWMSHKMKQPDSYLPDSDNLAPRLTAFNDLKFKNSTMREWMARENGRGVLLNAFKSLYHQMPNAPGGQIKFNEKKTLAKNVNTEKAGRRSQSKGPKPSSYSTHRKRPAFHSWGGKKRNTGYSYWSSNVPGLDQNVQPTNTRFVLKELPSRNERSILSFKVKRSQGHTNPEDSVANLETGQTHHGDQFENLGSDRPRNNLNSGESDRPTTITGSSPAPLMSHRNVLKNNSEPFKSIDNKPDRKVSGGDDKLERRSTENDPLRNRRQSNSLKLLQAGDRAVVKTELTQVKTNFDHVRTARSNPTNGKISRRLTLTHKQEERRSPSDVSLIKRGKREAIHAELSPSNLRDVNFMNELKQNGGGNAVPVDVTLLDADETSSPNEPSFPMFGMYPYTKLGEILGQTGRQAVEKPSLYTWWEKRDILGDVEKRPSFHSWSGKRNVIGELEKRASFHSWSGKRDSVGQLEKRPSFHSWSGKRDNVGEREKRPSFSSWSGKRDNIGELEKRPSFHSWSGKRDSFEELEKRPSFHSWSGKRDSSEELEKRPSFHSWSGKRDSFGALEKRPSFHSWPGKRDAIGELEKRPSFHSWSGKRDSFVELEKRPSFHSWSGKRDSAEELEKRPSFHSWSGKRDSVEELEKRPSFHSWSGKRDSFGALEKRPSFHSWSGKRDAIGELEKRPSFHSWSGKRDAIGELEKRPSFHSWSGKRDAIGELEKRPSFHSWSGKRDAIGELEKRPSFHSWSGKRDAIGELEKRPSFHSWSGKRDAIGELEKRPSFNSWSGKRDAIGELEKRPYFHSWSGKREAIGELEKRPSFHSWSGKRSSPDNLETDAPSESVTRNQLSNTWKHLPRMEETDPVIPGDNSFRDTLPGNDDSDYFLKISSLNVFPEKWDSPQYEQET
ncbi:unnamed protein product [Lymnaea stagnalis]|uniref:Uncharacterized protein n=1 Tax=Lymnaea stagnalis TaxID=6523 RepID=A0AAV2HBD5_LYMST